MFVIELAGLSEEQLHALVATIPSSREAVAAELERRTAYPGLEDAFDELAVVVARVEAFLADTRHTQSVKTFMDVGVPRVLKRVLATAKANKYEVRVPALNQVVG
jgi:hypothetical protein